MERHYECIWLPTANTIQNSGWRFGSYRTMTISTAAMREAQREDEFSEAIRLTLDYQRPFWGRDVATTLRSYRRSRGLLIHRTGRRGGSERLVLPVMIAGEVIRGFYAESIGRGASIYRTRRAFCMAFHMENLGAFLRAFEEEN